MIRIGLLVPQTGPSGLWAPSAVACAQLAVSELNRGSGILRQPVELLTIDAGSTARSAADAADEAVAVEEVDAIVGMFPSFARRPVCDAVDRRVPFVYTPQFEGCERDRSVVTTGETARELLEPAIRWLAERRGARRFFLCGSDYVWPRESLAIAKTLIREAGSAVVGERYMAFGDRDFGRLLDSMSRQRADVVLPYFLGSEAVAFHRAFAEAGLAARTLRFTSAVDETIVYGLDENATENLYVSSAYFQALDTRNNGAFLEQYHDLHGASAPPANAFGQSCYEGLHCLASLMGAADSTRASAVVEGLGRACQSRTARGDVRAPVTGARPRIHFARVDGYEFTVLPTL
ncbi:amino acid ABC transporter [Aureimonas sp. Leaf454]|uniref:substrate-binding domain-containing protein n=1 Tax=Aureimonas sp. Leaf454 TaxID=1736381 RepID=UPI0006FC251B|nr:substrate-binding domain-containing protein [Aureimonas sp. Leaf454]KQT47395.1 amino acid ABC transporter [Aureimonas sp. Leaf454]